MSSPPDVPFSFSALKAKFEADTGNATRSQSLPVTRSPSQAEERSMQRASPLLRTKLAFVNNWNAVPSAASETTPAIATAANDDDDGGDKRGGGESGAATDDVADAGTTAAARNTGYSLQEDEDEGDFDLCKEQRSFGSLRIEEVLDEGEPAQDARRQQLNGSIINDGNGISNGGSETFDNDTTHRSHVALTSATRQYQSSPASDDAASFVDPSQSAASLPQPSSAIAPRPTKLAPPPVPLSRNQRASSPVSAVVAASASLDLRRELPVVPPRPIQSSASVESDRVQLPPSSRARSTSLLLPPRPPRADTNAGIRKGSVSSNPTPSSSPPSSFPAFSSSCASASSALPSSTAPTAAATSALPSPPPRKLAFVKIAPPTPNRPASPSPLSSIPMPATSSIASSPLVGGPSSFSAAPPPPPRLARPSFAIPARIISTALAVEVDSTPYVPPPPPGRAIAANERLAPQRPSIIDNDVDSSDDDNINDESGSAAASANSTLEFPEATFANRRPPLLRSRRTLATTGHRHVFALRGETIVTAHQHVQIWGSSSHGPSSMIGNVTFGITDQKIHAIAFKSDTLLWVGTKDGHLFEVDVAHVRIAHHRAEIHPQALAAIFKLRNSMMTLDESGKLLIWGSPNSSTEAELTSTPRAQRIITSSSTSSSSSSTSGTTHDMFAALLGDQLWTATPPASGARNATIRVYDPTGSGAFVLTARPPAFLDITTSYGMITAGAIIPSQPTLVYLAHTSGHVSVWSSETFACLQVQRVSATGITSLAGGVSGCLWVGLKTGGIGVYRIEVEKWKAVKLWKAHKEPVTMLVVDYSNLEKCGSLPIASVGLDTMTLWDGLLREDWIDQELHLRQADYCTFRTIKTLIVSWNIDASSPSQLSGPPQNAEFLSDALHSVDSPDIIVFGFQEVIDLENKSLTAKTMLFGNKKASDKLSDSVSSSYRLWNDKLIQTVRMNMPPDCPYTVIHVGDMVGLFSCIFVKSSEREMLRDIAMIDCKTGMGGRYGNKGAILCRFVIDDTSMSFINCHLAAGQRNRLDRDRDLVEILETKSFSYLASSSPGAYNVGGDGTAVFDHEICFLSGDLNYRIDQMREAVVASVMRKDFKALLAQDQLLKGLANNQSFRLRSFKEAPITFAPTYKYDRGTDDYDSSAKRRIPAWCDRILYRADHVEKVQSLHYSRYECNASDHRPISAGFAMVIKKILPSKREAVWKEVENARRGVELDLVEQAKSYYSLHW